MPCIWTQSEGPLGAIQTRWLTGFEPPWGREVTLGGRTGPLPGGFPRDSGELLRDEGALQDEKKEEQGREMRSVPQPSNMG